MNVILIFLAVST